MTVISTQNIGTLFKLFVDQLPDPANCSKTCIVDLFFIDGKEVILYASRVKSSEGLVWSIDILD